MRMRKELEYAFELRVEDGPGHFTTLSYDPLLFNSMKRKQIVVIQKIMWKNSHIVIIIS